MGTLDIKRGTKMQLAKDAAVGQEPVFNMLSTFNKELDESAFLVSIPILDGKPLQADESQKFLFRYEEGEETRIIAGYVDDVIKEGIRRYWKIRRVTENRQFVKRIDVRMKVELPVKFMQDTWELNSQGEIEQESGETMDISNNGLAVYMNRWFEVGETCIFTLLGKCFRRDAIKRSRWRYLLGERDAKRRTIPLCYRYSVKICKYRRKSKNARICIYVKKDMFVSSVG